MPAWNWALIAGWILFVSFNFKVYNSGHVLLYQTIGSAQEWITRSEHMMAGIVYILRSQLLSMQCKAF